MNAIKLLRKDHQTVEGLFKRYEKAGDGAMKEKQHIAEQITKELSVHAAIEEELLYPAARAVAEELEDISLESLEEHHLVKQTLAELERMSPSDERFDAKMKAREPRIAGGYGVLKCDRRLRHLRDKELILQAETRERSVVG